MSRAALAFAFVFALAVSAAGCGGGPSVGTPCVSSRECSSAALVCDPTLRTCQECAVSADCLGAGEVCLTNRCVVPTPCTSSRMCPGRVCDLADGYCVDCNADVDCAAGLVCRSHACVAAPPMCTTDRECSSGGLVCDPVGHTCVECVRNADCMGGQVCGTDHRCAAPVDLGVTIDLGHDAGLDLGRDAGSDMGPPDLGRPDLGTPPLYHGWACPIVGCSTVTYNMTSPTVMGGSYPFIVGDTDACRAWKLAATVCTSEPTMYNDMTNWTCPVSGGFTDPVFGTFCLSTAMPQYACSTCPGMCNAGCVHHPLSLRNCAGVETDQM